MKIDAQHIFFREFSSPRIIVIRDVIKGGRGLATNPNTGEQYIVDEPEDYLEYGEYTIQRFPSSESFFTDISKLSKELLQEVKANGYVVGIDYSRYLSDLQKEVVRLSSELFFQKEGVNYYRLVDQVIHVDFMNNENRIRSKTLPPDHAVWQHIRQFSDTMYGTLSKLQEELSGLATKEAIPPQNTDPRISCRSDRETIQRYFYQLTRNNKNGEQILTQEMVDRFLQANFQGFGEPIPNMKLNPIALTAADIRFFIYTFIVQEDPTGHRGPYASLCKDNFVQFEDASLESITTNFSKRPKKYFLA